MPPKSTRSKKRSSTKEQPKSRRGKKSGGLSPARRLALFTGSLLAALILSLAIAGVWFVHHPRQWIAYCINTWPRFVTAPLMWFGEPIGDFTDAIDLTGHDAVYEYDMEAPEGSVFFAGAPRRISQPAPDDIVQLDKGEFVVGWSPTLRHPVWVAYHVPRDEKFFGLVPHRPPFAKDPSARHSPPSSSYTGSSYDRGHMAPNFAIATRFGADAQRQTFLMSNIAPQAPALNRGVWREIEHRIASLWTRRYGEIWVIVGCIPSASSEIHATGIDIPEAFWQVVVSQTGYDVRAFAVIFPQSVDLDTYPASGLVTIDELEELTGFDFLPDLASFLQTPLEAELPSRVWPVGLIPAIKKLFTTPLY